MDFRRRPDRSGAASPSGGRDDRTRAVRGDSGRRALAVRESRGAPKRAPRPRRFEGEPDTLRRAGGGRSSRDGTAASTALATPSSFRLRQRQQTLTLDASCIGGRYSGRIDRGGLRSTAAVQRVQQIVMQAKQQSSLGPVETSDADRCDASGPLNGKQEATAENRCPPAGASLVNPPE